MSISQATIDEVKNRIDIIDVISDFVTLKRTGQHYKGKSPFSDEKTPSFIVFPRNQNFKDFSSGKQGDAISFIMEYDGLSYLEAIKYLAKKYGVQVEEEEQTPETVIRQNERESLHIILNYAKDFFNHTLTESEEGKNIGLTYFKERGFTRETIDKFELGYSLDQWDALEKDASAKGYNPDLLEKAGLIIKKEDKQYDRFRGRVIFPIHSVTGKAIAFGARILKNIKNQPKYLNSPETEVYHKSDVLYGLFQSSRAIRNEDNCYLVEGYTDVISLHQNGVENVVSSSGTSLTENQIKLIHRHTNNITVLFDGDAAGIRASLRGIDMILRQGMNVKAVVFPDGEDPDSYARKLGGLGFKQFLKDSAQDFLHFKTKLLLDGREQDPIKKAETINNIIASLATIPDPVKRALYIKQTSDLLDLEEQLLYSELNKILLTQQKEKHREAQKHQPDALVEELTSQKKESKQDSIIFQEREAIRILINYGFNEIEEEYKLVEHYLEELDPVEFTTPAYNAILQIFKEELQKGNIVDVDFFRNYPDETIRNQALDLISDRYEVSENWERYRIYVPKEQDVLTSSVYSNILRIKFHKIKKLIALNLQQLKNENDPDKQTELQKINKELKKAEAAFSTPLGIVVS
ncbi:MAG: DNA primase [Cyclobacteriaceae bacterium]|nr:DNA primase [Cyclobacteriaceae bacterium]